MIIQHGGWTSTFHCKFLCEIQMWLIYCSPITIFKSNHNKILHTLKIMLSWWKFAITGGITGYHKYSLLMHRIKIKSPAIFLWSERNVFVGGFITFQSVLIWRYYNDKKPTRYSRYYHSRCRPPHCHGAWHPHHERWAYTSDFMQYISVF